MEVLREKPESPFFPWEDEGSGGEDSESDSEVVGRGGGGGRGGRGGRGGKQGRGNNAKRPPPRPPPCRGFAYVDLRPTDAKSLNRCVTLYNGCKWKGGVLSVRAARPQFLERLKMERDGTDERGDEKRLEGTEARGGASKPDDAARVPRAPLKVGDELEIAGRARRETALVLFGKGARTHKRGAAQFPEPDDLDDDDDDDDDVGSSPWREFEPSASHATLRRLGQLPEIERAAEARAAAEVARFEKRRARMFARLGKDTTTSGFEEDPTRSATSGGSVSSDPGGSAAAAAVGSEKTAAEKDRRFALPRAFFSSAAAAERFGLGPAAKANERGAERKRRVRNDSAEMRALAAFLGGSDDEDDAKSDDGGAAPDANPPKAAAKRPKTAAGAAARRTPPPRDPDEGGVPMARTGAKWWEAGGEDAGGETKTAPTLEPERNPRPTRRRDEVDSREPTDLARDFFRAAAPFAPFGTRPARGRRADASEGADGSDGSSLGDGEDSVSERALLRDWQGEDDESDEETRGEGNVSVSSSSQSTVRSGGGVEESESDEPGVVDFD